MKTTQAGRWLTVILLAVAAGLLVRHLRGKSWEEKYQEVARIQGPDIREKVLALLGEPDVKTLSIGCSADGHAFYGRAWIWQKRPGCYRLAVCFDQHGQLSPQGFSRESSWSEEVIYRIKRWWYGPPKGYPSYGINTLPNRCTKGGRRVPV